MKKLKKGEVRSGLETEDILKTYPNSEWILKDAKITVENGNITRIDNGTWSLVKEKKVKKK